MADWPYNTTRWQRLRKRKLQRDPLCEDCKAIGTLRPANTVDHRHAISDGGAPFPPLDDLSSKCPPCHSAKTARGVEAGAVRTSKPRKGCDADGNPLDAAHPWSKSDAAGTFEDKEGTLLKQNKEGTLPNKSLRAGSQGPPRYPKIELVSFATIQGQSDGR